MKDLERLKEIFLTDVDPETQDENLVQITVWEQGLIKNEAFASWRDHDVTTQIAAKLKETYQDTVLTLGRNRLLTDAQRAGLFAKQDAALWLLSLIEKDAKGAIEQIHKEIQAALSTV